MNAKERKPSNHPIQTQVNTLILLLDYVHIVLIESDVWSILDNKKFQNFKILETLTLGL